MTEAQVYCTLDEALGDLGIPGVMDEAQAMAFVRAASRWIAKRGEFLPATETRRFDGSGKQTLWIDPLIELTSITVDGTALTAGEYVLYPRGRHWTNGPYTSIELENRARWTDLPDSVVIAGRWGLWDSTKSSGATATQDINTTDTLTVSNGSRVSPGAVVVIDAEQELIEARSDPTDSNTALDEAVDNAAELFDLGTGDGNTLFAGEIIRVDFEQMKIFAISDDTLLVGRGWNGSTRDAHDANTAVYVYRTFEVVRAVNGTTIADHNTDAVSRVLAPDDVNYLARQMTGLMLKKAASGWAGKVGNLEMGEVFYNNEFPKEAIEQVMRNYRIVEI